MLITHHNLRSETPPETPFSDYPGQQCQRIVESLQHTDVEGHDLQTLVLPVSYSRAAELVCRAIDEHRPDLALLLGVAAGDPGFRIERRARNVPSGVLDIDGLDWHGVPDASGMYETTEDVGHLASVLEADRFPVRISDDAGAYVCNSTYYAALHRIATRNMATRCLFIHVPSAPEDGQVAAGTPGMAIDAQARGIRLALGVLSKQP